MKKSHSIDMLHGPLFSKLMLLAVPIILSGIMQQLFNIVDIAIAGRMVSSEAMGAIGADIPVIGLFINLLIGLSLGANVLIAKDIARKNFAAISDGIQTSMTLSMLVSLLVVIVSVILTEPVLELIATPPELMEMAKSYLRIYMIGLPFLMIYNFGSSILRADGDSRRPLYCLFVSNGINIFLDVFLTSVIDMGITGLAVATMVANMANAAMILYFLTHEKGYLHYVPTKFMLKGSAVRDIVSIGGPAGMQGVIFCFANVVIQSAINSFGAAAIAGVSAALTFEYITYFIINGIAQAAVTFTSQNYAVREWERCKRIFRQTMVVSIVLSAIVGDTFYFFRHELFAMYNLTDEVLDFAMVRLLLTTAIEFLATSYEIPGACLRGMGISMLPALETLLGSCLLRLVYVFFLMDYFPSFWELTSLYPVTWVLTGTLVMGTYFYMRRKLFV